MQAGGGLADSQLAFYSTAAQVIPVLLLVIALELSTFKVVREFLSFLPEGRSATIVVRLIILLIVALLFTGELLAVTALKDNHVSASTDDWVLSALLAGVIVVLLGVLERLFRGASDA